MNPADYYELFGPFGFDEPPAFLKIIALVYAALVFAGLVCALILARGMAARPPAWELNLEELAARTSPWRWRDMRLLILTLILLQVALFWLSKNAEWRNWPAADWPQWVWIAANGAAFHAAGIALIAWTTRRRNASLGTIFGFRPAAIFGDTRRALVFYLASLPVMLFAALLYSGLIHAWGIEPEFQDVVALFLEQDSGPARAAIIVLAFAVAPAFEELFFRGLALPLLARSFGAGAAVILSSLIFAAMHMNMASFLPLFILAVALALAYIRTKSIAVPVAMHAIFNGVNLALIMTAI